MATCTVGSWNIWVKNDREAKAFAAVILENNIDIVGIQEAAIYYNGKTPDHLVQRIAELVGYSFVFYPAHDARPQRKYVLGNAILSRYPIVGSHSYPLNPPGIVYDGTSATEERILAHAAIEVEKGKLLHFLTTHLQHTDDFVTTPLRKSQVNTIQSTLQSFDGPIVLTGDFNTKPENEEINMLESSLKRLTGSEPTWADHTPVGDELKWNPPEHRIDHIFASSEIVCYDTAVLQSDLSDHAPITAIIQVS